MKQEILQQIAAQQRQATEELYRKENQLADFFAEQQKIINKVRVPYEALQDQCQQLSNKIDKLKEMYDQFEFDVWNYSNGERLASLQREIEIYTDALKKVNEYTEAFLFKGTMNVDEYKAKSNALKIRGDSPMLRAIGVAMMGLAILVVAIGLLPPLSPVALIVGSGIGAVGCGFFYASRSDCDAREAQHDVRQSMRNLANAVNDQNELPEQITNVM